MTKQKKFKSQEELFKHLLDLYTDSERDCISEFCIKDKPKAIENLENEIEFYRTEWSRLKKEVE